MCSVAHKEAYLQGFLHRDISPDNILITENPDFEGGMLIDWDLCKAKIGAEEDGAIHRQSRTVCHLLPSDTNTLRINVMPTSQGTWDFIAADLLHDPKLKHSFVHDLESFFYVLLHLCVLYLPTDWDATRRTGFLNSIADRRRFGKGGGTLTKWYFMNASTAVALDKINFLHNKPLTDLVYKLKKVLSKRYEEAEDKGFPPFMSKEQYEALEFKHDNIIQLFNQALSSDGWPEKDDRSLEPLTLPSISSAVATRGSSKRLQRHLMWGDSSSRSSKRLKQSPVMEQC